MLGQVPCRGEGFRTVAASMSIFLVFDFVVTSEIILPPKVLVTLLTVVFWVFSSLLFLHFAMRKGDMWAQVNLSLTTGLIIISTKVIWSTVLFQKVTFSDFHLHKLLSNSETYFHNSEIFSFWAAFLTSLFWKRTEAQCLITIPDLKERWHWSHWKGLSVLWTQA